MNNWLFKLLNNSQKTLQVALFGSGNLRDVSYLITNRCFFSNPQLTSFIMCLRFSSKLNQRRCFIESDFVPLYSFERAVEGCFVSKRMDFWGGGLWKSRGSSAEFFLMMSDNSLRALFLYEVLGSGLCGSSISGTCAILARTCGGQVLGVDVREDLPRAVGVTPSGVELLFY